MSPIAISLPIADRKRAMDFYRDVFGFETIGSPTEDGVPEPLSFRLGEGVELSLIPVGGFGWVLGEREIAKPGVSECLLTATVADDNKVSETIERVRRAGGEVLGEPASRPWGFEATCADLDGHVWQVIAQPQT
ncbi:VOC family protein [Saccharomonospora sp. NPDC006951]